MIDEERIPIPLFEAKNLAEQGLAVAQIQIPVCTLGRNFYLPVQGSRAGARESDTLSSLS